MIIYRYLGDTNTHTMETYPTEPSLQPSVETMSLYIDIQDGQVKLYEFVNIRKM